MTTITHATFTSLNTDVRMLGDLYSLNDLHRAAGGQEKHSPRHWSRLQQTKDLIAEIEKEQICAIQSKQGLGTFVCKELVCDYAAWIDAPFHLKIIRTFLAISTNQDRLSTKADRVPLKDAVNMLVAKTANLNYSDAYKMVHQKMGIGSVKELAVGQIPAAVEYVHGLIVQVTAVQGELLPRQESHYTEEKARELRVNGIYLMSSGLMQYKEQTEQIRKAWSMAADMAIMGERILALLGAATHNGGRVYSALSEAQFKLCHDSDERREGREQAERWFATR